MPLERTKGKLRPGLPRASDLLAVPAPSPDRRQGRDKGGRFAPGHRQSARSRGWRRAIRDLAAPGTTSDEVMRLSNDSGSLYRATLATLPYQGPLVNPIAAENARCAVLSAHFAARALQLGLDTKAGRAALELSMRLGQRAERTAVTAWDLATRAAEAERKKPQAFPWFGAEPPGSPATASTTSDDSEPVATDEDAAASQDDTEADEP